MGFGMAAYVTQDIVSNVFKDLDTNTGGTSSGAHSKGSDAEPSLKKRKHGRNTFEQQPVDSEVGKAKDPPKLSVKIAALKALETLLTVAGSVGAESWRPRVDHLLIHVATSACKMGRSEEHLSLSEDTATWTDFQLAALSALLASLHSPGRTSPPYLGRCLDLFTRGRRETGTKLSEFCGHALLTLESVIHPRVLPLVDSSSAYGASGVFPDSYSNGYTHFSSGLMGEEHDESNLNDDDLFKTFIAEDDDDDDDDDTEIPHAAAEKNPTDALLPASTSTSEKKEDEVMVEARESEGLVNQTEHPPTAGSEEAQPASKNAIEESLMSDRAGDGLMITSKEDGSEARADVLRTKGFDATMAKSFLEKRKHDRDSDDESIESLPDIVDADPDSDSDSD